VVVRSRFLLSAALRAEFLDMRGCRQGSVWSPARCGWIELDAHTHGQAARGRSKRLRLGSDQPDACIIPRATVRTAPSIPPVEWSEDQRKVDDFISSQCARKAALDDATAPFDRKKTLAPPALIGSAWRLSGIADIRVLLKEPDRERCTLFIPGR